MLKKRTSKAATVEALQGIIDERGTFNPDYLADLATVYIRNDRELNRHIYVEKHRESFLVWDILLTVLNNQMEESCYYSTAEQVRRIVPAYGLKADDLLNVCRDVLRRELVTK